MIKVNLKVIKLMFLVVLFVEREVYGSYNFGKNYFNEHSNNFSINNNLDALFKLYGDKPLVLTYDKYNSTNLKKKIKETIKLFNINNNNKPYNNDDFNNNINNIKDPFVIKYPSFEIISFEIIKTRQKIKIEDNTSEDISGKSRNIGNNYQTNENSNNLLKMSTFSPLPLGTLIQPGSTEKKQNSVLDLFDEYDSLSSPNNSPKNKKNTEEEINSSKDLSWNDPLESIGVKRF